MGTPTHWYLDETKHRGLVVVVAVVPTDATTPLRRALRAQLHPRQRYLHFTKESDQTRRSALEVITASPVRYRVYRADRALRATAAREACLRAVARDALEDQPRQIVVETDQSVQARDQRWLREELGPRSTRTVEFHHLQKHEEPLLWVPDAIAWCLQRGQPWSPLVADLYDDRNPA